MNKRKLIHKLGLGILKFGEFYFQTKDIARSERRGASLGMMLYRVDKKHRERALSNVAMVFPAKTPKEVDTLVREMFRHFGRVVADFMRVPIRTDEEMLSSSHPINRQYMDDPYNAGKGVFCITAHLGNWERCGHWLGLQGVVISSVARDANDGEITERVNQIRGDKGMKILSRGNAARGIFECLKRGEMIGILPDQNSDEAFIPFFGFPAGTTLGPAKLHLKTKAPIMPACCLRTGPGQYALHFFEPIIAHEGETAEALMTRINKKIEEMILLAPEQYLWMHDRWRNARKAGLL